MIESILYKTAIYRRLSLDDGSLGESGSIQTQKMMLEKYCRDNNFTIKKVYIDDGYSRLNFDRPAFKRLIADIESGKINKLETRKDKLYKLTKKVYDDALNEIIDSETSSKMIKEYQEEQKKISSEIETLKNLKQEEESTIENYKLLKEKVNEFLEFKELNSLIVHSLISRIEVGYRDNPRTIKIYYKFIDDSISN